jgi:hypothetical protein
LLISNPNGLLRKVPLSIEFLISRKTPMLLKSMLSKKIPKKRASDLHLSLRNRGRAPLGVEFDHRLPSLLKPRRYLRNLPTTIIKI